MQFVYFYVQAPDSGEELRLSMASVRKNFAGTPTFLVVGQKPPWYDGPLIPMKQFFGIRDAPARMPFRDTQKKIMVCATSELVDEEFVWMMDDTFMMKPTTIEDMRVPRYDPWYRVNVKAVWHQCIRVTFAALKKHGKPNLQYGTHLPHVFMKTNLQAMIAEYEFPTQLLLFEILYGNTFHNPEEAIPYGETWQGVTYPRFLKRLLRPATRQQLEALDVNFMNYCSKCWNPTMKLFLRQRFG
jgi:hypothetical protein